MTHYGDYRDILVSKGIPVRQDIERTRKQINRPRPESERRDWPALLRMLDRQGVDFRS